MFYRIWVNEVNSIVSTLFIFSILIFYNYAFFFLITYLFAVNSSMADMARLMLRDCNTDMQEIMECWLCYKHSNDKSLRNWFCKPCRPPHELIYAKSKGCPYWPAKVYFSISYIISNRCSSFYIFIIIILIYVIIDKIR